MDHTDAYVSALTAAVENFNRFYIRIPTRERLSFTTLSVLDTLAAADGPLRLTELTRTEQLSQPGLTQLVSRLERDGLVERRPDPTDRRATLVRLTAAGRRVGRSRHDDRVRHLAPLVARLSPADRTTLARALPVLGRLVELDREAKGNQPSVKLSGTVEAVPAAEPETRRRDADRTRKCLLEAAFDEFSTRGFAGARVGEIAERAGVNKQLITYYFGGKAGLYRALQRQWLDREAEFADPDAPIAELVLRYLHHMLADPRGVRLAVWRALSDAAPIPPSTAESDLATTRARQDRGEVAADLDPAAFQLAVIGMVAAPVLLPDMVRDLFGIEPRTTEFEQRYGEQLRRILAHLATAKNSEGEDE
ncbi:MarR family transcriptional regulator [Nocardia sp. NPDC003482]